MPRMYAIILKAYIIGKNVKEFFPLWPPLMRPKCFLFQTLSRYQFSFLSFCPPLMRPKFKMFYFSEIIEIPILLFVIFGMYQGIEISHPIYSLIFCDLIVCFLITGSFLTNAIQSHLELIVFYIPRQYCI